MPSRFEYLIGKTKKEVLDELGDGFNYYPWNIWTYTVGKTWWGMLKVLKVSFENDKVTKIALNKKFWG